MLDPASLLVIVQRKDSAGVYQAVSLANIRSGSHQNMLQDTRVLCALSATCSKPTALTIYSGCQR